MITDDPTIHNTTISKELGRRWNNLSEEQRRPFVEEAARLKELHLKQFPQYKYRPTKKKRMELEENLEHKEQKSPGETLSSFLNFSSSSSPWMRLLVSFLFCAKDVIISQAAILQKNGHTDPK